MEESIKPINKEEHKNNLPSSVSMGDYVSKTMDKYITQGLSLPTDYNVQNAVISSYLIIQQDPKLNSCDKASIASALIDMATMGLNASKKQCYFIPYDNKLKLSPSYFGKITALKRIRGVIDVRSDVIYKDTDYELIPDEFGNEDIKINKICPLEKRSADNIVGAWAKIILEKDVWGSDSYSCVMTLDQIHKSWNQGATKGKSPAHVNFPDEMCKKSVINRCCKNFVNSAKDNDILIEAINRTTETEYQQEETPNYDNGKVVDIK